MPCCPGHYAGRRGCADADAGGHLPVLSRQRHGRTPTPTIPIIAGQQYDYLLAALTAYRNGDRRGGQAADMQTFAKQLKPSDLPIAARFFADLREMKW